GVGVGVQGDVGALGDGRVQQVEQVPPAAGVGCEVHGGVRQVQRAAGLPGQLDHLGVGLQGAGAVGAVVRAVVAAVGGDHPAQLGQFGAGGVHARGVGQAGGHADRAL